jgi:hypothetical protein
MVGFIAHAGMSLQPNLTGVLPDTVRVPDLPYVQDITNELNQLKSDPTAAAMFSGVNIPDLSAMQTVKINFNSSSGSFKVPEELLKKFQSSDVTTSVAITKEFAGTMFGMFSPTLLNQIQGGIQSGIDGVSKGIDGIQQGVQQQEAALKQLQAYAPRLTGPLPNGMSVLDMLPAEAKGNMPQSAKDMLAAIKSPADLQTQIKALQGAIDAMKAKTDQLKTLQRQLKTLYDAIPGALKAAEADYLAQIDAKSAEIEKTYQSTMNGGYKSIYLIVAISSAAAAVFLAFYRKKGSDLTSAQEGSQKG